MKKTLKTILGWVACAPRPLRWREVQSAISINLEDESIDADKKLVDDPKALFSSFIEIQSNGMVDLVHGTARE